MSTINTNQKLVIMREVKDRLYKRPFDLVILILAHVLLLPVWIVLWMLIPLCIWFEDRGPVFYVQQRTGRNGRLFTLVKFRTMVSTSLGVGLPWTSDNDPRITRVGRVLRSTALDELPQVISMWKGDMSLVGPRALSAREQRLIERHIPEFRERLRVRPGLTGPAQIYDSVDDAENKLRYDLEYIEGMSPWLDVKLLLLSLRNTLMGRWDHRSGKRRQDGTTRVVGD